MISLYRKYRPQRFGDLVGQENVVITLKQAVVQDRVGHAYLFSGPKGSGKTTTARLLAKAVNCRERKKDQAEPCNRCESCLAIDGGRSLDILEIDAASHRGIEEIRELREAVKFAPAKTEKKVYIIDEVHMLTREAFNALLKTLEEPPSHAIFVMATTEPHKVPPTIKSRSQHFQFRRAGIPDLVAYLSRVSLAEKIPISEDALKLIAGTAEGSFRDSLTFLEQIWVAHPTTSPGRAKKAKSRSQAEQKEISVEDARSLLGLAERALVFDFLAALADGQSSKGMQLVGEIVLQGLDVQIFIRQALEVLRALLLVESGEEKEVTASFTKEEIDRLMVLKKHWGMLETVRIMEQFIAASQLSKVAPQPEIPLEMLVAEWTSGPDNEITSERRDTREPINSSTTAVPVAKEIERVDEDIWKSILSEVRETNASLYSVLREAIVLGQTADGIALGVRFLFHAEILSQVKHQSILTDVVTKTLGRPARIIVEVKPEAFNKKEEELLRLAEKLL